MSRVGRRVLRWISLGSLALCFASAGLWLRAQFRGDGVRRTEISQVSESDWIVRTSPRAVVVNHIHAAITPFVGGPLVPTLLKLGVDWTYTVEDAADLGIGVWPTVTRLRDPPPSVDGQTAVALPFWLLVGGFGVLPIVGLFRRRQTMPGHCRRCGYDLRASPGRCPECGATSMAGNPN